MYLFIYNSFNIYFISSLFATQQEVLVVDFLNKNTLIFLNYV